MSNQSTLSRLLDELALEPQQFRRIALRAPHTYKTYTIPKKNGGTRVISQPARETKYIQSWLIENIFKLLPVHSAAAAYVKGSSIKKNASTHKDNSFLVKIDFERFFPSIKCSDLHQHFRKHLPFLSEEEILLVARLCSVRGMFYDGLSIGSPASPILSNSVMYEFDSLVSEWSKNNGFVYTRYADDLTFSTNIKEASIAIEPMIRDVIDTISYPSLSINKRKTLHLSKKTNRTITGVIINTQGQLSLGRTKKREISSLVHRYTLGQLDGSRVHRLQGLLGYAYDLEPKFINTLSKKYSPEIISELLRRRPPRQETTPD
ncbi:retron St85 family RNA-directed DNA polymerase [Stutzerimonas frequens]|uniref:RNA-directed DNA polymerase n=1 Tax=Stutzerimonas frequens TaxID=2968969 RepID=A0AA47HY09_9GAMM|nr:retron St85 family RNA-directed DNA polymerase [Stutzerimonas frequens]WAE51705.1 retron St85 family RNA-directed DNA polymerase [Stutzerimonas frequens]